MPPADQDLYDSNMGEPAAAGGIHTYSLFGESARLPDVLHCETIAARWVRHDWELAPHRHDRLHQLLLVLQGGGLAQLDGLRLPLQANRLVNVPCGDVHAFSFLPGTKGWVATLPDELVDELLRRTPGARAQLSRASVLEASTTVRRTMAQLAAEHGAVDSHPADARTLVLRGLAGTLLGLAAKAVGGALPSPGTLSESNLLRRFESLLEQHFRARWTVSAYAAALAVSPTHLSRVVRGAGGGSAARLIDARVMREARRLLAYTPLRIVRIADELGFVDAAHFSRAFSRAEGCSPRRFRERLLPAGADLPKATHGADPAAAARPGVAPPRRRAQAT